MTLTLMNKLKKTYQITLLALTPHSNLRIPLLVSQMDF